MFSTVCDWLTVGFPGRLQVHVCFDTDHRRDDYPILHEPCKGRVTNSLHYERSFIGLCVCLLYFTIQVFYISLKKRRRVAILRLPPKTFIIQWHWPQPIAQRVCLERSIRRGQGCWRQGREADSQSLDCGTCPS
jgi:hypothetical protein